MMYTQLNDPRIARWQARLSRVPRWGWIAFMVGAVVPAVALVLFILFTALVTGAIVMAAVLLVGTILSVVWRLMHRRQRLDDGRRNVQIVVRSARAIDP